MNTFLSFLYQNFKFWFLQQGSNAIGYALAEGTGCSPRKCWPGSGESQGVRGAEEGARARFRYIIVESEHNSIFQDKKKGIATSQLVSSSFSVNFLSPPAKLLVLREYM